MSTEDQTLYDQMQQATDETITAVLQSADTSVLERRTADQIRAERISDQIAARRADLIARDEAAAAELASEPDGDAAQELVEHLPTLDELCVVSSASGQVIDPAALDPFLIVEFVVGVDIAEADGYHLDIALERLDELQDTIGQTRRQIHTRLVAALDRKGKRTANIDGAEFETNAPTTESYDLDKLRAEFTKLVADGVVDQEALDEVIVTPMPTNPPPRIDKRAINRWKKSDKPEVQAAIVAATNDPAPQGRTLKRRGRIPLAEVVDDE